MYTGISVTTTCSQESAFSQAIATITGSMETEREGLEDYIMDTATLDECRTLWGEPEWDICTQWKYITLNTLSYVWIQT